jgi:hypothetical protein
LGAVNFIFNPMTDICSESVSAKFLERIEMRKLKLQMQTTIDGFVAEPNGELNWMILEDLDDELKNCTDGAL